MENLDIYKNKVVFVTGATGFIGSNLVLKLMELGAHIKCIYREESSFHRANKFKDRVDWIKVDLSNPDANLLDQKLKDVEIIFHLAASGVLNSTTPNWEKIVSVNIFSLGTLINSAQKSSTVNRLILTGTCFEYGNSNKKKLLPRDALHPLSIYGATKAASTLIAPIFVENTELELIILRIFHTYGPYESINRFVPTVITKALKGKQVEMTKGESIRDFIFVEDVIDALLISGIKKLTNKTPGVFNIGSGQEYSISDVAKLILKLIPENGGIKLGAIPYKSDEIYRLVPDIEETKKYLDWEAKYSLRDGLIKTIEWFKNNN
ncbi:MAG: NAD-dependent epimerase/dehydratase family protein [Ignavibacteriaceae bacterium]